MALGNANNNQRQESTYYSRVRFVDRESGKSVRFKFWKGLICLTISKGTETDGGYKSEDLETAYFSPTKAHILSEALKEFIPDKEHLPVGVNLGMSETQTVVVFFHEGDYITLAISKINAEGKKESEQRFTFKDEYDYHLNFNDYEGMKFEKQYHINNSVYQIADILESFSQAMYGSMAYSVMDFMRFVNSRTSTKLNSIMDKLGIQRQSSFGGGNPENSYFNRQGAAGQNTYSQHHDSEELDDLIS
jgi:hypothetical protein